MGERRYGVGGKKDVHCPADLISLIAIGNCDKMGNGIKNIKNPHPYLILCISDDFDIFSLFQYVKGDIQG